MAEFKRAAWLAGASLLAFASSARADDAPPAPQSDIVVTAPRQEEKARQKQKDAPVLVNIQSAETIQKYPDYNAAEALGRIPGISLSSDTGEGRFVNIRGIDANLNGATYGGVVLLNTFPAGTAASGSGRAVEFDTVPTGAIDGIVVYKTLSPDREAEGLGGQIELTPRSAKNLTKPFLDIDIGGGYEPLHRHGGPYTGSIAVGGRFGFDDAKLVVAHSGDDLPDRSGWISNPTPFSFVITASRKDDQRGVDDTEPSYANDGACGVNGGTDCGSPLNMVLGRTDFRRYDYSRRRFGYGGEFAFTPNDENSFYVRYDVAGYVERSHKDHFYANFDGNPSAPDANGFVIDRFQPQVDVVDLEETHRNTVAAAGGENRLGDFSIDYRAAYSRATYDETYYDEARFYGADTFYGRYNNTSDPKRFYYQFFQDAVLTIPFVSTDALQYGAPNGPTNLSAFSEQDVDKENSYVFNVRHPLTIFGSVGELKAGVSARLRDKVVNDFAGFGSVDLNLSSVAQSIGAPGNYYFGRYPEAPLANFGAIDQIVRSALPVLAPSLGRDFKDKENIYAGYLMYTVNFGHLGVLAGVRVEATHAVYGNFLTATDAAGNSTTTFVNHTKDYTNVFPTVQLKYAFNDALQLRATYSTGIARPGFSQAGGNAGVDFTTTPRPQYSAGNPDIKPTTGNNFDLDLEYYLPNGGIIQFGAFDKQFKNYIFRSARVNVADPIFLGQNGDFITYVNESAYARGIELAYHQKFTMLPGLLGGLGIEGNLTLVKSRFKEYSAAVSGTGLDEYGKLPGTSSLTWNLAAFYERDGVAVRLSSEYVGPSLFALNGDRSLDTVQSSRLTMDLTSSYELRKGITVYLSVKNLLDTPLRYVDGSSERTQQIEYYGQTYEGGVRLKL